MASDSPRLMTLVMNLVRTIAVVTMLLSVAGTSPATAHADDPFAYYDLAMYDRPAFEGGTVEQYFGDGLKELWLKALQRPDPQLQRLVVDTIALAHRRGLDGIAETKPQLVALLDSPDQPLPVLRAVAQTLILIDASDQAQKLAELSSRYGAAIAPIVEPALANWKSPAMKDQWLQRLQQGTTGQSLMTLAIEGLAAIDSDEAIAPLTNLVRSTAQPSLLRMRAAEALGEMQTDDLVELAREMPEQSGRHPEIGAIIATRLLAHHQSPDAIEMLQQLVSHSRTTVQAAALSELYDIDFQLVDRYAESMIDSRDANVRRVLAQAMIDTGSTDRVGLLAALLDDVNPSLRRFVGDALIDFGKQPELSEIVLEEVTDVLNENEWRGCEQACRVLGALDHEPAGRRMVELLKHPRGEVKVASAWALTQLRVPELLPDMLDHAKSVYEGFKTYEILDSEPGASLHIAHLFIAFGDQQHKPAESLLRDYLPKNLDLGNEARAAAAWAVGMLHIDDPEEDLVKILAERLSDVGMEPEREDVRQMCAVSLGRMKAESQIKTLRKFANNMSTTGFACYWAIEQMTGEEPPAPYVYRELVDEWFMAPLRPAAE